MRQGTFNIGMPEDFRKAEMEFNQRRQMQQQESMLANKRAEQVAQEFELNKRLKQFQLEQAPVSAERATQEFDLKRRQQLRNLNAPMSPEGKLAFDRQQGFDIPQGVARDTEKEQRIARIMERGVSREDAIGIADGVFQVVTNPLTGSSEIVDKASGAARPLVAQMSNQQTQQTPQPPRSESTAPPLEQANNFFGLSPSKAPIYPILSKASGMESTAQRGAASMLGQVGISYAQDHVAATQNLQLAANLLTKALQNNPRYAEGERKQVREDVGILPSFLNSPVELRTKFEQLNIILTDHLKDDLAVAQNPNLPMEMRKQAYQGAMDIAKFLNAAGMPQQSFATQEPTDIDNLINMYTQ
jgi:hypothetical protein